MIEVVRGSWVWIVLSLVRFVVELAVLLFVATWLTVLIANIRMYFGPWADPPGTNEIWAALLVAAAAFAIWRVFRRLRQPDRRSDQSIDVD